MATKTNQPTRTTDQIARALHRAQNAHQVEAVERLTAELMSRIHTINTSVDQLAIEAAHIEAIAEDEKRTEMSMTMEDYADMKDREAIAADCDAMKAEDANQTTVTVELAHREALAEAL